MYGMKQKNINKKAKITTITISATIPSQQEIKVENKYILKSKVYPS